MVFFLFLMTLEKNGFRVISRLIVVFHELTRRLHMTKTDKRGEKTKAGNLIPFEKPPIVHENDANFHAFLEAIDDVVVVGNSQSDIIYANRATSEKLGYSNEELKRMKVTDLNAKAFHQEADTIFADMLAGKRNTCPLPLERKDGSYLPVETRVWFGKWSGKPAVFGISKDLSSQQAAYDRFFRLFHNNPAPMAITSTLEGQYLDVNAAFLEKLGYAKSEIIGKTSKELNLFQDPGQRQRLAEEIKKNGGIQNIEIQVRKKNGELVDALFSGEIINNQVEKTFLTVMMDISPQKQAEQAMAKQSGLLSSILDSLSDFVYYKDTNGAYLGCNPKFAEFVGKPVKEIIGKTSFELFEGKMSESFGHSDKEVFLHQTPLHVEEWLTYPDGRKIYASTLKTPFYDTEGDLIGIVGISRDITESKLREDEIEFLSFHDKLTGLYNLRFYEEELKRLDTVKNLPLSIIMGDVNGLKFVNDSFGHAMGDELLVKMAESLRKGCRVDDIIARIGGDEFAVILPKTSLEAADRVVKRIQNQLEKQQVGAMKIKASFGTAVKSDYFQLLNLVFKDAEDRMYQQKLTDRTLVRRQAIDGVMETLFAKSPQEADHGKRVGEMAKTLAQLMHFSDDEIVLIEKAGQMHDVGKYFLEAQVLNSSGKLTPTDMESIRKHPETGYRILSSAYELSKMAFFVLEHHERWDGTGYPKRLQGNQISVPARILALAEAYDAMTRDLPYHKSLSKAEARQEVQKCSGSCFDPEIVELFLKHQDEF
jgi:diguanylate cyclase (GGDEF)-like protein/PAS domain S-box-containing protein